MSCAETSYQGKSNTIEIYEDLKYNLIVEDGKVLLNKECCFKWSKRLSLWTLKVALVIFFILFIVGPFIYKYCYGVQRSLVFLNFVSWPKNPNYNQPSEYGVDGALNFYVTTNDGVRLGVWHALPESTVNNKTEYSEEFFENALRSGHNIVIYNHGNAGHRVAPHRVELYKLLKKNFHVISFDYRGYGDSADIEPTENGVVSDSTYIYKWVLNRTDSKVFVWGHSLGTGVSTHMLGNFVKENIRKPTGLILESPFTSFSDEIAEHPFAKIFRPMPWFHFTIIDPMLKNGFVFASDRHIIKIDCPILILHAEDDGVVPFELGQKLYNTALDFRRDTQGNVTFVGFDKKYHYGHKFICRAPEINDIIQNFMDTSIIETEEKHLL